MNYRHGTLTVNLSVSDPRRTSVEMRLVDAQGKEAANPVKATGAFVSGRFYVENARKWSAEDPYLYRKSGLGLISERPSRSTPTTMQPFWRMFVSRSTFPSR